MTLVALQTQQGNFDTRLMESRSALRTLLLAGVPINAAISFGKDSTAVLNLLLQSARELAGEGFTLAPIIISHGDTGVENPVMAKLARTEIDKVLHFASHHHLPVTVAVARPSLAESWVYRTIGQGKLPALPGDSRDCTVSLKVNPQRRLRRKLRQDMMQAGHYQPDVTLIGTRFDESASRRGRMEARGESWNRPWTGENGDRFLSPIATWSEDDVWTYLGLCRHGNIPSYSNMDELWETYLAASSSSCAVVADMAMGTTGKSAPCSSRTGCWTCLAAGASDRSLNAMIDNRPDDYGYLAPLARLRDYLYQTRMDWNKRNWVGRTINAAGYVKIQPDVYSPTFLANLLRFCITIDVEESRAAEQAGLANPRFEIITPELLIAVCAEWSRQGFHRPFHALSIYRDIVVRGHRYPVPDAPKIATTPLPAPRYVYVGSDWDENADWAYTGLRNPLAESFEGCPASDTTTLANGVVIMDVPTEDAFSIDPEAAAFILMDMDYLIEKHHNMHYRTTAGYLHYIALGSLQLSRSQRAKTDEMLRRTAFRERHGLTGPDVDLAPLLRCSISQLEMDSILHTQHIPNTPCTVSPIQLELALAPNSRNVSES